MNDIWQADFYKRSKLFESISVLASEFSEFKNWPTLTDYNAFFQRHAPDAESAFDKKLIFVEQGNKTNVLSKQYEPRIYLHGEIQTRLQNWHDFFQVLVWAQFTKTKTLINSLHANAQINRINKNAESTQRTHIENALTIFDECGSVIISSEPELLDMIREHEWQALFMNSREQFVHKARCIIFGHAMFEKALTPYVGMTSHALLLQVDDTKLGQSESSLISFIDELMCNYFSAQAGLTTRMFDPLPILGVPGWSEQKQDKLFYQNKEYFRPKEH